MRKFVLALVPVVALVALPQSASALKQSTAVGAGVGVVAGAAVAGPVGAVVGGVTGGYVGSKYRTRRVVRHRHYRHR